MDNLLIMYTIFMIGILIGTVIGAVTTYQSLTSRIITYFVNNGITVQKAKKKMHEKIISLKYKFY